MSKTRAVVLARGLGTRMRAADPDAELTAEQELAAAAGDKAMIPLNGRPFLDYGLSALADAGIEDVALVVAPEHDAMRRHYARNVPSRIRVSFVVQPEPRGTADALLAVEGWSRGEPFLAMNADNLYPATALSDLAGLDEPGLAAFERHELMRSGNIPPERLKAFALIEPDSLGYLAGIVEKPAGDARLDDPVDTGRRRAAGAQEPSPAGASGGVVLVSMNCWRFDSRIFAACRDVPMSARGELELPEAVALAVRRGVRFRVLRAAGEVLDMSRRADAAEVGRRLMKVIARP